MTKAEKAKVAVAEAVSIEGVSLEQAAETVFLAENNLTRRLKVYLTHGKNVLFVGKKGVGKTSIVKALWEDAGLNYRFFSAATMDPWVDFIGVPRAKEGENGEQYLELIRPREFQDDLIEGLFFDEFNRAPKKIRNAVMELIQFKSINGRKFKNLKIIWAAINPEDDPDEEYDVEALDPAQKDRFHVQVELDYKPDHAYFSHKFGPETAEAAITWWETITDAAILNEVSPRRLDYALEINNLSGGSLDDVLPKASNPQALRKALKQRPALAMLKALRKNEDKAGARTFLDDDNNFHCVVNEIIKTDNNMNFFLPLLDSERLNSLISKQVSVQTWCWKVYEKLPEINTALESIAEANTNRLLTQQIKKRFQQNQLRHVADISDKPEINKQDVEFASNDDPKEKDYSVFIDTITQEHISNTSARAEVCKKIWENIPVIITYDDAKKTIGLIDVIIGKTHVNTIGQWRHYIIGVVNSCVKVLHDNDYKFGEFKADYRELLKFAMNDDGFYLKIEEKCKKQKKTKKVDLVRN